MKKTRLQKNLNLLKKRYFLDPSGGNVDKIVNLVSKTILNVVKFQGKGPTYERSLVIPKTSEIIRDSEIPSEISEDPWDILKKLPGLMQDSVKAGHPYMVKNIIPTPSIPALAANLAVSMYMGNGVTGEDAGQVLSAEIACASAISKLAGIDPSKSAGVFTFGGTATNMYADKMALAKIIPDHSAKGIRENVVTVETIPSHYSHKTAADWLGIGQDNCIRVRSKLDQTTNMDDLEKVCEELLGDGKMIICINAVGGTTSSMGIDDIKKIFKIRNLLIKKFELEYSPHIHVDSVLGWAYLCFVKYDFNKNKLGFSKEAVTQLKKIVKAIKTLKYADSFGVDFHKTGFVAYTSSMIMVKDKKDLMRLQREGGIMTSLFHDDDAYNPGKFTMETSRSSANILSTWIALQTFGVEGYQSLLGNAIENGIAIEKQIEKNSDTGIIVANQQRFGPDIFIRCYPKGVDPKKEYKKELSDDILLKKNTDYTTALFKWIDKKMPFRSDGFSISKSSAAIYTKTNAPMVALRVYPLSPYMERRHTEKLINKIIYAKKQFDKSYQ